MSGWSELSEHGPEDDCVESCDCRRCAIEFRDRYRAALASVSAELGLPPTMGPAPGELMRILTSIQAPGHTVPGPEDRL